MDIQRPCGPVCERCRNRKCFRKSEEGCLSLRSGPNVTAWRYLVLEHDPPHGASEDEIEHRARLWISLLVQLALPVCAIYRSGGKSVHGLVMLDDGTGGLTQEGFRRIREVVLRSLVPYGADAQSVTPVRLTRMPNCHGRRRFQTLLYLDPAPDPDGVAITER